MIDPHFQHYFKEFGFILNAIGEGSYFGIFLFSMLVSFVIPLPEIVLLIMIGFLARIAGFDLAIAILASITGTVIGDNVLYRLSFFGNKYVQRFNRKMRANKLIKYEHLVANNVGRTIFFLRFIAGVRFFGPVVVGTLGLRWKKFFFYNVAATALHSLFFILLGFYAQRGIVRIIAEVEIVKNLLLFSSVLIVGVLINIFSRKKLENVMLPTE